MILESFDLNSGQGQDRKRYRFVDRLAVDSPDEQTLIGQFMIMQLAVMQDDAKCAALGLPDCDSAFGNLGFGVYEAGALVGVFLVATLGYQSGPWRDPSGGDWTIDNSNPAIFHARPMPGFVTLPEARALDLSTDAAHHFLARRLRTVGGNNAEFHRLSWAIFKGRGDANSQRAKRIHDHAKADNRFRMVEAPDATDPELTRVDLELA